jgi:hypothetical protein
MPGHLDQLAASHLFLSPVPALSRASRNTRNILTAIIIVSTGDINIIPGPVRAARATADDGNVGAARGDPARAGDVFDGQVGDGDSGGRVAVEVATVVVLFDEDAVPRDIMLVLGGIMGMEGMEGMSGRGLTC